MDKDLFRIIDKQLGCRILHVLLLCYFILKHIAERRFSIAKNVLRLKLYADIILKN